MTITKKIIQQSPSRVTIKLVATAGADTSTINLKTTVTLAATGTLTFVAGSNGTGTITRSTGSWVTDFGAVNDKEVFYVTLSGSVNNNTTFSVKSFNATTLTVYETVIAEAPVAATATAYKSDLGFPGQSIGTPHVGIASMKFALGGSVSIVRNSVEVSRLFGTWMALNDGFGLEEQSTSDLVVTFNTAGGTIILELVKKDGFNPVFSHRDNY